MINEEKINKCFDEMRCYRPSKLAAPIATLLDQYRIRTEYSHHNADLIDELITDTPNYVIKNFREIEGQTRYLSLLHHLCDLHLFANLHAIKMFYSHKRK